MLVLLLLLISRLINRLGLRISHSKVFSSEFQKVVSKSFLHELLKTHEKIFENPRTFFLFVLYCTKRRYSQIKPQLKVKKEDGSKAALKPSIFIPCLSVCLIVCLFVVSNKRQNGWTDQAHILRGTSHDPREGLWMIKISKVVSK